MWIIPQSISSRFAPGLPVSISEYALQYPERGLWCTSNGKPIVRPFLWPGWKTRRWSLRLFGAVSRAVVWLAERV
jgi:hypothetical protein